MAGIKPMFAQIADFLITNLFELFIYVVLLRFWMQVLRAPFRNPLGQFVIALTDWAVLPLRRVIPSFRQLDLASFIVAWIAAILMSVALYAISGGDLRTPGLLQMGWLLLGLVRYSLNLLVLVVFVQVAFSWFNPHAPLAYVFESMTRPFYNLFRRFIPPIGNVDLSPLFVILIAYVLLFYVLPADIPRRLLTGG